MARSHSCRARRDRKAHQGFSLIEALVMLAVTALAASLLFTFAGRGARDSVRIAERGLKAGDRARLEAVFRESVRAAVLTDFAEFEGSSRSWAMVPAALPSFCPYAGLRLPATIALERDGSGGRLVCRAQDRALVIARWVAAEADFGYSPDGALWSNRWPLSEPSRVEEAPLVRLTLREPSGARTAFIERAGEDAMLLEAREAAGVEAASAAARAQGAQDL